VTAGAAATAATSAELKPGDIGYAPAARVAITAGDTVTLDQLGYDPGRTTSGLPAQSTPPLATLTDRAVAIAPAAFEAAAVTPAALDPASVNNRLQKMVGDLSAWVAEIPYPLEGENAVVANFFQQLAARRANVATASQLGRTEPPDMVSATKTTPSTEYFQTANLAVAVQTVAETFQQALAAHGVALTTEQQAKVDQITAAAAKFAQRPTEPPAPVAVPAGSPDAPPATIAEPPATASHDMPTQAGAVPPAQTAA